MQQKKGAYVLHLYCSYSNELSSLTIPLTYSRLFCLVSLLLYQYGRFYCCRHRCESFPFKCAECKSFNFLELIVLGRWREKFLHTMLCTNDLCCCEKLWQVISNEMYKRFQSHTNWFCCAECNHIARDGMIINVFQQFFRFSLAQFMMRTSKVKAILFNIDVNAVKRCSLFNKSQSCLLHK